MLQRPTDSYTTRCGKLLARGLENSSNEMWKSSRTTCAKILERDVNTPRTKCKNSSKLTSTSKNTKTQFYYPYFDDNSCLVELLCNLLIHLNQDIDEEHVRKTLFVPMGSESWVIVKTRDKGQINVELIHHSLLIRITVSAQDLDEFGLLYSSLRPRVELQSKADRSETGKTDSKNEL